MTGLVDSEAWPSPSHWVCWRILCLGGQDDWPYLEEQSLSSRVRAVASRTLPVGAGSVLALLTGRSGPPAERTALDIPVRAGCFLGSSPPTALRPPHSPGAARRPPGWPLPQCHCLISVSSLTNQYKPSGSETPGIGSLPAVSQQKSDSLGAGRAPESCTCPCLVQLPGLAGRPRHSWACRPTAPSLPPSPPWLPHISASSPVPHEDTHHWIWAPPPNPGPSHLEILSFNTSAKIPFPNEVTLARTKGEDLGGGDI